VDYLAAKLTPAERRVARRVVAGKVAPADVASGCFPLDRRITMLDLAGEDLQYLYTKGEMKKEEYVPRFLTTLQARSSLGGEGTGGEGGGEAGSDGGEGTILDSVPSPGRPDEGHRSNRLSLGWGVREDDPFLELRWRPAYHGLMDAQPGYRRGSQIVFFDPAVRYSPRRREISFDRLDLIDIVSIAPRSAFFRHTSWKVKTGFDRARADVPRDRLVWTLAPGVGLASETRALGLSYLFLDGDLQLGGALRRWFRAGLGASAGTLVEPVPGWKLHFTARYMDYGWGDVAHPLRLRIEQNIAFTANGSLGADVTRETRDGSMAVESRIFANAYF
jgi:hypothetical protein